ncbi:hypothetical protein PTKIN_Ptkin15bG0102400 [Pterospermum kingtungense]
MERVSRPKPRVVPIQLLPCFVTGITGKNMDPARYSLQQGWDNDRALEGFLLFASRDDCWQRDYAYDRHSYYSDYDRGSRRDFNWRRRESHYRDCLSRGRDQSSHKRHGRSHLLSCGPDDRARLRSPREVGTMGKAIERTTMMIAEMRKLRRKGTVKSDIRGSIILWCASFSMFLLLLPLHLF